MKLPQRPEAPPPNPRWPPAARDSAPRHPRSYSHLLILIFRSTFLVWTYFINFKNNTKVINSKCYAFATSPLLRLFFSSNFKNDDKYLTPLEIYSPPPPRVVVATALAPGPAPRGVRPHRPLSPLLVTLNSQCGFSHWIYKPCYFYVGLKYLWRN